MGYRDPDPMDAVEDAQIRLYSEVQQLRALARRVAKLEALPMWTKTRNGTQMWSLTGAESVRAILADAQRLTGHTDDKHMSGHGER